MNPELAIIIPACNEAPCLDAMLRGLAPWAAQCGAVVAVGLNDCTDASREILRQHPDVLVGETAERGYGQGCLAAISAVQLVINPNAWLFMAADAANDPAQLPALIAAWREGADLVLGQRTWLHVKEGGHPAPADAEERGGGTPPLLEFGLSRVITNVLLGLWASVLSGKFYADLGPYRLISDRLFTQWQQAPGDLRWGWTIEPQIIAPRLGMKVSQIATSERPRIAGEQKVTGVSLRHSLRIGRAIFTAGWRAWRRLPQAKLATVTC